MQSSSNNVFYRTERFKPQRGEHRKAATAHLCRAADFTTCVNVLEIPVSMPPRGIGRPGQGTGALKQLQEADTTQKIQYFR